MRGRNSSEWTLCGFQLFVETALQTVLVQKRLRREKRFKKQLKQQLDLENKRRAQLEDALRAVGASDQIVTINEHLSQQIDQKPSTSNALTTSTSSTVIPQIQPSMTPAERDRLMEPPRPVERIKQEREETATGYGQPPRDIRDQPPPPPQDNKPWGYSGMELMNTGAAFWQNYSDSLAQELEMERKSRQQQADREVKSPLQDRSSYYKNSVMFTSSAT